MKTAWVVRNLESGQLSLFSSIANAIQYVKVNNKVRLKKNDYSAANGSYYLNSYVGVRKNKVIIICDSMMIK